MTATTEQRIERIVGGGFSWREAEALVAAEDEAYRAQAERNRQEDGEPRRSFVYADSGIRRHRRALSME